MRMATRLTVLLGAALLLCDACRRERPVYDHPRLTSHVVMHDVTFWSTALQRNVIYRVILPSDIPGQQKLPVVYLLHGGGGSFRDWSNYSDVARFAERGLILVMPDADDSYYTNSATTPRDRYEDYIVRDLIADAENKFPAASDRPDRAIIGVSMGGFGGVKVGLRHPELFNFVGAISPAVDVPSRPFSLKRVSQWHHHRSIFGPWNGQIQRDNDPFILARSTDPARVPYLFLTCGDKEGLLPANRDFAALLEQRHIAHVFHIVRGGHDWTQWNQQLDECFQRLREHMEMPMVNIR